MKLNRILFAQDGAAMPAPEEQGAPMGPEEQGAPAEGGAPAGGSPEEQLQQIAGQLVEMLMQQIGDPQAVMAILQMAMEMLSQAAQQQAPAYQRMGGRLRRVK